MCIRVLSLLLLFTTIVNCHKIDSANTLTIGTIVGPETELVELAKNIAAQKYGLHIKIIEFNDYNSPNEALNDGSLDANIFQHLPYLQAATQARNFDFEVIGKTFVYPMGIYANKLKNISEIKDYATIAIPNDPSNEERALLLLAKAGLITVKSTDRVVTMVNNPKHLKIKLLDAAQLPRILSDVDAAVINTNFAIPAGLNPNRDAIYKEDQDSPYANLVVIRHNSLKKHQIEQFIQTLHSQEVQKKAREIFNDAVIPAW